MQVAIFPSESYKPFMRMISVIVPTHNRASVLLRALDSVVKQMYCNWELIVVDDASTDETVAMIKDWRERNLFTQNFLLLTSVSKESAARGVSAARNIGARAAKGTWLAFLDSDDEWLPEKLSRQAELMNSYRWIHGEEIWVRDGVRVNQPRKYLKSGGRIFSRCVDLTCVGASTVIVERDLFFSLGGFREDFLVCEDYDLWLKLAASHDVGFVTEPVVYKYGGHADQLSRKYIGMDHWRCLALQDQVTNPALSLEERAHLSRELARRSDILQRGYCKHGSSAPKALDSQP